MKIKFLLLFYFVFISGKIMIAQSIELSTLLEFQQKQSPGYISTYLSAAGGWTTNEVDFQNNRSDYKWYKATADEKFQPHTKDQLSYNSPLPSYKSAIVYVTITKGIFDRIIAQIQSTMTRDATLINDERVKFYQYSNANFVVEVVEPFQPQKDNIFRYAFFVYDKVDYTNGFKIR